MIFLLKPLKPKDCSVFILVIISYPAGLLRIYQQVLVGQTVFLVLASLNFPYKQLIYLLSFVNTIWKEIHLEKSNFDLFEVSQTLSLNKV